MKKHIQSIIVCLLWIYAAVCSSVSAEEQAGLSFEVKTEGSVYDVALNMSGKAGPEMLQFCVKYDDSLLELQSVTAGEVFRDTTYPTISNTEPGYIYCVWEALKPLSDGNLLIMQFRAKENTEGSALIIFDTDYDTLAADGDFNDIPLTFDQLELVITGEEQSEKTSGKTPVMNVEENTKQVTITTGKDITVAEGKENLIWSSSNENVAVVENGVVTAVSEGYALITAENEDGSEHESYAVTITNEQVSSEITNYPQEQQISSGNNTLLYTAGAGIVLLGAIALIAQKRRIKKNGREG